MMEVPQETLAVRSHGYNVAWMHKHDWVILILLVAIDIILNHIDPFYRFVGKDMMTDLKYPYKEDAFPFWTVPIYAVLLPMAIFLFIYFRRRDNLHHAILGILFSALITLVITDAVKDAVNRPRPDFFWRCFPDGSDKYDQWGDVICHGNESMIREGHKSCPSGHTSLSFAGLAFLSLYLSGKNKAFDRKGHVMKLCLVIFPLLLAALVGVWRLDNYKHHWQDVFAGGLLGFLVATFCYLQFFPPPYHVEGWAPFAYFRDLEQARSATIPASNANAQATIPADIANSQNTRSEVGHWERKPEGRRKDALMGMSLEDGSSSVANDLECGRR